MGLGKIMKVKREGVNTVLGVDASTQSLAFCVYGKDGPEKWGEIKFKGNTVFERLAYGQRHVNAMKEHLKADLIVFESAIYVQNKKTVILLAYAFGALVSALMDKGTEIEEVSPIQWQNFIGNKALTKAEKEAIVNAHPGKSKSWYANTNRNFRKQRTIDWVLREFGISVESDNVSDAIGVAHFGYKTFGS